MTHASDFRVTLLGTGTPIPRPDRFGPSTLVEAGDQKLLIDAGRGATIRLYQLGVPMGRIDVLFLTHYHSDHTSGVPDFWLTGWLGSHYARRTKPMRVIGPVGAKVLMAKLARSLCRRHQDPDRRREAAAGGYRDRSSRSSTATASSTRRTASR